MFSPRLHSPEDRPAQKLPITVYCPKACSLPPCKLRAERRTMTAPPSRVQPRIIVGTDKVVTQHLVGSAHGGIQLERAHSTLTEMIGPASYQFAV
jgi:hypothetical protein